MPEKRGKMIKRLTLKAVKLYNKVKPLIVKLHFIVLTWAAYLEVFETTKAIVI